MPKCKTVKNPCKICLGPVKQKNGLQCQGICASWIHYSCLNYTPGKIKDIKDGIIKVTCPCPDCNTSGQREFRTDEPFSCTNLKCPANTPPKCDNDVCPLNQLNQQGRSNGRNMGTGGDSFDRCGVGCKNFKKNPQASSSDHSVFCPSGCSSSRDVPGDISRRSDPIPSLGTLEQMCNTVGQLSNQINDLMCKMKQVVKDKGGKGSPKACTQPGPRSMCPKPCFCPGNPGKRR